MLYISYMHCGFTQYALIIQKILINIKLSTHAVLNWYLFLEFNYRNISIYTYILY